MLLKHLQSFGFEIDNIIIDDRFIRCKRNGSKKKNGWYIAKNYNNNIFCNYGDWATGEKGFFTNCDNKSEVKKIQNEYLQKEKESYSEKLKKSQITVSKIIEQCTIEDGTHPYLIKKKIKPYQTYRFKNNQLIIPVYIKDVKNPISCQRITLDCQKFNMTEGVFKNAYHLISGNDSFVCICEGFSTGATIHEATGYTVFCCMTASNMVNIAEQLYNSSKKDFTVIICADNDWKKESEGKGNAGIKAAKAIFEKYGYQYVYPQEIDGTDFNDLYLEKGLSAVTEAIIKGKVLEVYEDDSKKIIHDARYDKIMNPPGLLKDIADYYNETAVKPQPLFAIATGLILGSLVLGRRYNTGDYENYTSLYFLIVAKSGTGKDHVKKIVRSVLSSAGLDWMERGEGYTASNTVIKSLSSQALQLSFFEEIGQRLKEASNQHKSNAKGVFRKLLDVWSSCHSFVVGEEFSDGTIPKADNPALTMVGLTTPKALTDAITEDLIEQGFINRILPFISRAERTATPLNKKRTDPPEKISKWFKDHYLKGNIINELEIPVLPKKEDEIIIPFTDEALNYLVDIEYEIVEKSNALEKIRLEDMLSRNREISMRVSLIVAALDDSSMITRDHVEWAWNLVTMLYDDYIQDIKRKVSGSDFEKSKLECLDAIRKAGKEGIPIKNIPKLSPFSKYPKRIREDIFSDLQNAGLIDLSSHRSGKRGPAIDVWVALK